MEITYLNHSGFSAETENRFLLFDFIGDFVALPQGGKKAYAFVSHSHSDHFGEYVKSRGREGSLMIIGGAGVRGAHITLSPGESIEHEGMYAHAYPSTDEGVSFLVKADGFTLFHAGDLNLWHWKDESTEREVKIAERLFNKALQKIPGAGIDAAFFPVDPRMGTDHDEGALRFAEEKRPKIIIPMHFWGNVEAANDFVRRKMPPGVTAIAMTETGQTINI